jgi:hypothetical protein
MVHAKSQHSGRLEHTHPLMLGSSQPGVSSVPQQGPLKHERSTVPLQTPAWQVSSTVQGFPSSHGPFTGVNWQPLATSQESSVQGL